MKAASVDVQNIAPEKIVEAVDHSRLLGFMLEKWNEIPALAIFAAAVALVGIWLWRRRR